MGRTGYGNVEETLADNRPNEILGAAAGGFDQTVQIVAAHDLTLFVRLLVDAKTAPFLQTFDPTFVFST